MRARTIKQGVTLAFGRTVRRAQQRGEYLQMVSLTPEQIRWREAQSRGNVICWSCDAERIDDATNCAHCTASCVPF